MRDRSAEEAIGQKITYGTRWNSESSAIIGVVKNFNQRSPKEKHIPMIFNYSTDARYLSLKINTSETPEAIHAVKSIWDKTFSESPFTYFFLDERYNQQYKNDLQFGEVIGVFSALAIFIACLGLFGLSSFTVLQRTKEVGIRKVLGSSILEITQLLSRDFVTLVLIAGIVAIPIAYYIMDQWLATYAIRINLNAWLFIFPFISILIIALLTISFQTIKAARSNPVNSLRSE